MGPGFIAETRTRSSLRNWLTVLAALGTWMVASSSPLLAQECAYIVGDNLVVLDTGTNAVVGGPVALAGGPRPIALTPDGGFAYVGGHNTVSVIDTSINMRPATC